MAITTYEELKTSVANWLHRTDIVALVPDFIALAEDRMNGDPGDGGIAARQMELRAPLTCDPNGTITARYLTLPSDMLEMRRLSNITDDPATVLEYKSPDQLMGDSRYLLRSGRPDSFTVIGSQVEISPAPDSAYSLELVYRQAIPALSDAAPTNWLLTLCPSAYLFGALCAAAPFTQDEARLAVWEGKYRQVIDGLNGIEWYSGSTMRVRAA